MSFLGIGGLRRRTVSEKYLPPIDGIRFVLIIIVVLLHISNQCYSTIFARGFPSQFSVHPIYYLYMDVLAHATRCVPFFFAVSGFILALPFARHRLHNSRPVSLSFYFLRRLTRLEPPNIVILTLRFVLMITVAGAPFAYYFRHFIASVFYVHNVIYNAPSIINIPAWTLEIEIQFYCLVPLFAYYFSIRRPVLRKVLLLVFMALMGVIQLRYFSWYQRSGLSILYWIQYFLDGFLIADLFLTVWHRIPEHWLWEVLTLPIWAWTFLSNDPKFHAYMPFLLIPLFISAFKAPLQRRFLSTNIATVIGGMCYTLYITHNIVISACAHFFRRAHYAPPLEVWLVTMAVVLAFGLVYFILIERPCMDPNWPKRLWRRFFPEAAATTDPAV